MSSKYVDESKLVEYKATPAMLPNGKRPGQKVVGRTAEGTEISVPHQPYEYWIDPAGNVIALPMRTTRVLGGDKSGYYHDLKAAKILAGWLPWKFDHGVHPERCGCMNEAQWLEARDPEIGKRRAKHAKQSEQYAKAWHADAERQANLTREALIGALGDIREAGKRRSGKDE